MMAEILLTLMFSTSLGRVYWPIIMVVGNEKVLAVLVENAIS
jgi:hypothetical protein